jgi:hypothetical protein
MSTLPGDEKEQVENKSLQSPVPVPDPWSELMGEFQVIQMIEYGKKLVNIPYKFWEGEDIRVGGAPFWVGEDPVPIPWITACSCTGLINLIRRYLALSIPGHGDRSVIFPGGIREWIKYLKQKNNDSLEKFQVTKTYKKGSLLIRPSGQTGPSKQYEQGHVAIIYSDDKTNVLDNELLHCYPDSNKFRKGLIGPGVRVDKTIASSHAWDPDGGFYKYVVAPELWLTG